MMNEEATGCEICSAAHGFRWTDTHGVGVCYQCGAPYTIFHYAPDSSERLDKPPALALNDIATALARRYWAETKRMVFPGAFDMGMSGHRGATYSGATNDDINAFHDWLDKQPEALAPKEAQGATP